MSQPIPQGSHDTDAETDHLVETPESLRDSDRPLGAEKFGTTRAEAEQGAPLDQRLAGEVPDGDGHDPVDDRMADDPTTFAAGPEEPVGRLVAPDEGARTDTEKDVVARDVGVDGGDASAEEAALHLEEER